MTEDKSISKVTILLQQERYSEAENIISDLLKEEPNNIQYLSLLAEVNLQKDEYQKAEVIINSAIGLSPDISELFYTKSRIEIQQEKIKEAEASIYQAINLDTNVADYFALLANIQLSKKQYENALTSADKALGIDAENIVALNTRSTTLIKLNRPEESFETIEGALREDPNNAYTHTNYGFGLLEKGDYKKALEHFREALSKDPSNVNAQVGVLEAIKAKNPFYRIFLKYSFWIGNLTEKYQWGVIIAFFLIFRSLRKFAENNEALQPYLYPLVILLAVAAFSTWIITPISNLFLRFNKYGQLLLSKKEKISSNLVAVSLGIFILGILFYVILSEDKMLVVAAFGFAMMLPLGIMFSPSKNKNSLIYYTAALAIMGIVAIMLTFIENNIFNKASVIFFIGFIAFQWIANYMLIKEDNLR